MKTLQEKLAKQSKLALEKERSAATSTFLNTVPNMHSINIVFDAVGKKCRMSLVDTMVSISKQIQAQTLDKRISDDTDAFLRSVGELREQLDELQYQVEDIETCR